MLIPVLISLLISVKVPDLPAQADAAQRQGQTMKAIALMEAYMVMRPEDSEGRVHLAELYSIAGLMGASTRNYRQAYNDRCKPCNVKPCWKAQRCRKLEILSKRMKVSERDEIVPRLPRIPDTAKKLFKAARSFMRSRKYRKAERTLRAAVMLDPMLKGVLPKMEYLFRKLKDKKGVTEFYLWYLRIRPAGPYAAKIRRKLRKSNLLGRVDIESSWPCMVTIDNHTLMNRRGKEIRTPVKGLTLPEGRYSIGFICLEHHLAKRFPVSVRKGQNAKVRLDYGVLRVSLKPWGRIKIAPVAGPRKGRFMDLGLYEKIGVPAGKYVLQAVAHDGSKKLRHEISIAGGTVIDVTSWNRPPKVKRSGDRKKRKKSRSHRRSRRRRR